MAGNSDRPPAPPAGWFADPAGSPYLRWWDGAGWTDNFIDARTGAPPAELAPAPTPRAAIAASEVSDTREVVGASESSASTAPSDPDESSTDRPEYSQKPAIALPAAASPSAWAPGPDGGARVVDDSDSDAALGAVGSNGLAGSPGSVDSADPAKAVPPIPAVAGQGSEAPPLTRREARARERLAEEARTGALTVPLSGSPTAEPAEPEAAQRASLADTSDVQESPTPLDHAEPFQPSTQTSFSGDVEPGTVGAGVGVGVDHLLAQPVSAARSVDSLGEVSEPDAVAPPEESVSAEAVVPSVGSLGIPGPETLAAPEPQPPVIPLPGSTVPAPSIADFVSGPPVATPGASAEQRPTPARTTTPTSDALFDFAGITPTGAVPTSTPVPTSATSAPGLPRAFPLAPDDASSYTPMETRRPVSPTTGVDDTATSSWAVWVFAALPLLHLALAWFVLDRLAPGDLSVVRWAVLLGPILVYLLLAGVDRWALLRAGQLSVAPVAYAIVPPLYLAIRVVRMGVRALAPLVVWIALTGVAAAALVLIFPGVLSALTGS